MAKAAPLDPARIVVDTREQAPLWTCPPCTLATLKTGDYSVVGLEDVVAVERKSAGDLISSLGGRGGVRRRRFQDEFERLADMRWGRVVVEATPLAVFKYRAYGKITGAHALATMASWELRYRVPVFYADNRDIARWWVGTVLRLAVRHAG